MNKMPFYFKYYAAVLLCFLYSVGCWGQVNYVLNPSFEQYKNCPNDADQIKFANYWSSIDTPELHIGIGKPE